QGLMASQICSLHTQFCTLPITRTEIKKSDLRRTARGSLDLKSSRIQSLPGHDSGFSRLITFIFEKRPPGDVRRQISNIAPDARKISLTGIVDKSRKWFTGLQIPQRFK